MRHSVPATAMSLCLIPLGAAGTAAAAPTPATQVPTAAPAPDPAASDAAARHAKRTACLKEAKARKLLGASKTSFIKDCVAAH
jgi:hypothetical protein